MFKLLCFALVIFILNKESSSLSVLPNDNLVFHYKPRLNTFATKVDMSSHMTDFLGLIDLEKVMGAAMTHIYDPEVLQFLGFILSPELKDMILELETISEFREALGYLAAEGYDVYRLINLVHDALNLPPFAITKMTEKSGKGINGLIEDLIASLPLEDMKKLFESKLETSPEVAQLFETINSEEFLAILRRMSQNSKFLEFKAVFEGYGFDFKYLCQLAIGILGDYYQGVFCM